ncbi:hypothetical protein [Spiroplasma attinicola]|uniref:hypothetical protein n=1 Tax=Spiroplasma attinicola TaxID=2904537 RepID=UPI002022B64C|nr:hypothetical protein [Spiroplasma sp. JKS002670]MCL8209961.1 hypothetical protein [Spiroplasma sp. JKS002670]
MKKTNNNENNAIKIKQLNPKFRLFLFIIFNWYITTSPVTLPIIMIYLTDNYNLLWTMIIFGFSFCIPSLIYIFILTLGIKYLPGNYTSHYVKKNNQQLQKIKNLEIINVNQLFTIIPICDEVYSKNKSFVNRTSREFRKLSQIEFSANRLVVNGKINNSYFSWGIVSEMKKTNFKVFLLAILYFGPILGIIFGLFPQIFVNAIYGQKKWWSDYSIHETPYNTKTYTKLGGIDLFPYNVGRINSENYLIFAAKLQKQSDLITLIPNDNQYQWPKNLSEIQKEELETLIKEMSDLPNIYIYQDNISIMMKKYHYNVKDNNELQTWELLKQANSNNEIHFNYLNNAIKIYHIFNQTI